MCRELENFHLTLYIQCVASSSWDPLEKGNIEKIMENSSYSIGYSKFYYDTKFPCMLKLIEFYFYISSCEILEMYVKVNCLFLGRGALALLVL